MARGLKRLDKADRDGSTINFAGIECVKLYEDTEPRLAQLVSDEKYYSHDDAVTWLSAALASHRSCLDGLEEKGLIFKSEEARNLTLLLKDALFNYGQLRNNGRTKARKGEFSFGAYHNTLIARFDA